MVLFARSGSGSKMSYSHVLEIKNAFKETRLVPPGVPLATIDHQWAPHGHEAPAGRGERRPRCTRKATRSFSKAELVIAARNYFNRDDRRLTGWQIAVSRAGNVESGHPH